MNKRRRPRDRDRSAESTHLDRNRREPAKTSAAATKRCTGRSIVGKPTDESRNRHPAFQPRQVDADAQMRAGGERKMPVGRTRNIQPVGRIELLGIPVGCTDAKIQLAAGRQLNAAQSCVNSCSPISKLIRTFESKKLFDGGP